MQKLVPEIKTRFILHLLTRVLGAPAETCTVSSKLLPWYASIVVDDPTVVTHRLQTLGLIAISIKRGADDPLIVTGQSTFGGEGALPEPIADATYGGGPLGEENVNPLVAYWLVIRKGLFG
ncbi:hypothetical protein MYX76_12145 [Desulfobacterota bacterium AH_259_B03_O07]|nr:hypothetical protein [Desulfobacterota bacterium AH_259_B03_O07]